MFCTHPDTCPYCQAYVREIVREAQAEKKIDGLEAPPVESEHGP